MREKKTIQEWELEKGIRINKPIGFKQIFRKNSNIYANKYSKEQFKRAAQNSYITIKTEKGLEFIND